MLAVECVRGVFRPKLPALPRLSTSDVADALQIARARILGYLERQRVITVDPDADVLCVSDELAERDPALAQLAAAAVAGLAPAGPEFRRKPVEVRFDARPGVVISALLSVREAGFSLHAATRAGAADEQGREALLKYILRPPLSIGFSSWRTHTGSVMGTPAFMPPEQALGRWEDVDAQSDLWALGATMFTLLTGEHVHRASTVNELLVFAATKQAPSLAEQMPGANSIVTQLVDCALASEKSERWSHATAMRRAVRKSLVLLDDPDSHALGPAQFAEQLKPATSVTAETPHSEESAEATGDGDPSLPEQAEPAASPEAVLASGDVLEEAVGTSDAHPEMSLPENGRTTSIPGLEQNSRRHTPRDSRRTLVICTMLAAGIVAAVVYRRRVHQGVIEGHQTVAAAPMRARLSASPLEQPCKAPDVTPAPSNLLHALSVEDIPMATSAPQVPAAPRRREHAGSVSSVDQSEDRARVLPVEAPPPAATVAVTPGRTLPALKPVDAKPMPSSSAASPHAKIELEDDPTAVNNPYRVRPVATTPGF